MEFLPADQIVPIATLIGTGLLGLLAAFGTWWGRRRSTSDQIVEVAGALVDSKAVERLTAAIEAHAVENMQARTGAKEWQDALHKLARMIEDNSEELRELRGELRALGNAISHRH